MVKQEWEEKEIEMTESKSLEYLVKELDPRVYSHIERLENENGKLNKNIQDALHELRRKNAIIDKLVGL